MKIPDNLGNHLWSSILFNPQTCQLAYHRYMKPTDEGFMNGMDAYFDYENDKCIVRHFDNPLVTIRLKGFLYIVADEKKSTREWNDNDSITVSEVRRIMEENKPTKPKIYAKINNLADKKKELMADAVHVVKKIQEATDDEIPVLVFELASILRKNLFTEKELASFINN